MHWLTTSVVRSLNSTVVEKLQQPAMQPDCRRMPAVLRLCGSCWFRSRSRWCKASARQLIVNYYRGVPIGGKIIAGHKKDMIQNWGVYYVPTYLK